MTVLRYIDVFSGIGGFRAAADLVTSDDVKFDCVGHVELDRRCREVYEGNWSNAGDEWSIGDIRVLRQPNRSCQLPNFDMLVAGFPCQSFANIGSRTGLRDDRGALFIDLVDLIRSSAPRAFLLENVAKLTALDRGATLQRMVELLKSAGYRVVTRTLTATDFGLPQARRRLFFFGVRSDVSNQTNLARRVEEIPTRPLAAASYPTTWHILDREMPERHIVPARTRLTVLRANPKWQGRLRVNPEVGRPITATMAKWHRANQDNYFTESFVMGTFRDALFDLPVSQVFDERVRRITPVEALRMQGFGGDFIESFNARSLAPTPAYRMIGNAVPVPMAAAALSVLAECVI